MRCFLFSVFLFGILGVSAQSPFTNAYIATSYVPDGLLEAVAWTNTHMVHLDGSSQSCSGIPQPIGIMGLQVNGANYFKENGALVAQLSNIDIPAQLADPQNQILAYALAYDSLISLHNFDPIDPHSFKEVLHLLSEIPDTGYVNYLAKEMQVYSILRFMNSQEKGALYNFNPHHINLETFFGAANYAVLSADKIEFTAQGIYSDNADLFTIEQSKSTQYGPAIWNPAPACNFSSRNSVAVSAITIHTVQGSYAGAISWAQNCASSVSYHYVVRSSDGQITQMVLEEDKAWHVGSENPYTIGYEHEGFVNDPSWYTEAMYQSSADLSRDITNSGYGIPALRTYYGPSSAVTNLIGSCTKIKGHQHFPNQTHTDPGINWDWEKYYQLINNSYTPNLVTNNNGTVYDTGGSGGNYQDDEREFWLIQPSNAASISLNFNSFNTEAGYDFLYIYDGDSVNAPLIGVYDGITLPPPISSTGNSLLMEFRSDCSTVSAGWEATFTSTTTDNTPPSTTIVSNPIWHIDDFSAEFIDQDAESGIKDKFFIVSERDNGSNDWKSKGTYSFANETFDQDVNFWTTITGAYSLSSGMYQQTDIAEQNSNSYFLIEQPNIFNYLYEWDQTITSNDVNQRAGLHFFCDNPNLPNRGNSYFVYLRENDDKLQIYSVVNDVFTLEQDISHTIAVGQTYNCKVRFSPMSGMIELFVDNELLASWEDPNPLPSGNSISFRSGGCSVQFDNLKVYRSRANSELIGVGPGELVTIESESALQSARIETVVLDSANNWSTLASEEYLIDYSPPVINFLHDGISNDVDTFFTSTIFGNWSASDIHSDILNYSFAVGTLPNLDDVIGWTSAGITTSLSEIIANPIYDQVYHISLKTTNGANIDATYVSDGQRYLEGLGLNHDELFDINIYPNPSSSVLFIDGIEDFTYAIIAADGSIIGHGDSKEIDVSQFAEGIYTICIFKELKMIAKKFIVQK